MRAPGRGQGKWRADEKHVRWLNALHLSLCNNKHQSFENGNKQDLDRPPRRRECIRITEWSNNTKHEVEKTPRRECLHRGDRPEAPRSQEQKIKGIVFLSFVSDNQNQAGAHDL